MYRLSRIMTLLVIIILPVFMGCEGPQGPQGPQGPEGPEGPVGPAGENGSVMYSGQGAPSTDIGGNGDYYLNTDTGEMYGPKDDSGWGNPIIVLKGEDGQDGQDGQDGKDGSQIQSGSGAPDASLGVVGDSYLDKDNYDLYGPKTDSGWGSPLNLKGADGNANVTRYIYPGYEFSSTNYETTVTITGIESKAEMRESSWNVYLVVKASNDDIYYDHIPGVTQLDDKYSVTHIWKSSDSEMDLEIRLEEGGGWEYDQIEVVRIEASNTEDQTNKQIGRNTIIPDHLDFSDYDAVAEYYNFYSE